MHAELAGLGDPNEVRRGERAEARRTAFAEFVDSVGAEPVVHPADRPFTAFR